MARYFFALDITASDKQRIELTREDWLEQISMYKLMPKNNFHLTLAFLGDITDEQKAALFIEADNISNAIAPISSGHLTVNHLGLFTKPQVLYLGVSNTPEWLLNLANGLKKTAVSLGIFQEDRPYTPHVSIARKAKKLPIIDQVNITIDVKSFSYYESISTKESVIYVPLKQWYID